MRRRRAGAADKTSGRPAARHRPSRSRRRRGSRRQLGAGLVGRALPLGLVARAVIASDKGPHTRARYSARGAVRSRDIGLASARPQRRICIWSDSVPSYGPSEQPRLAAFLMENSAQERQASCSPWREQPASRAASAATAVNQPRRHLRCDALVLSNTRFRPPAPPVNRQSKKPYAAAPAAW